MNDILGFVQEHWRWAFTLGGFALGQFLNHRRTLAITRKLELARSELAATQVALAQTQQLLDQERERRIARDLEWSRAGAMFSSYR